MLVVNKSNNTRKCLQHNEVMPYLPESAPIPDRGIMMTLMMTILDAGHELSLDMLENLVNSIANRICTITHCTSYLLFFTRLLVVNCRVNVIDN